MEIQPLAHSGITESARRKQIPHRNLDLSVIAPFRRQKNSEPLSADWNWRSVQAQKSLLTWFGPLDSECGMPMLKRPYVGDDLVMLLRRPLRGDGGDGMGVNPG